MKVAIEMIVNVAPMGKSFSEALILASTKPQYDKILFIELQVQYMKIASSVHVVYTIFLILFWHSEQFMYPTCSGHKVFINHPLIVDAT